MRPYVHVNVAVSADGKLSTRERRQVKISGQTDFDRVDALKASCDAVMVGIGTVIADNPSLTVKSYERIEARVCKGMPEHPVRIVVDSSARTPPDAKILHKGSGRRIIAVSPSAPEEKIAVLAQFADIIIIGREKVDLISLLEELGKREISSLMVEGGGTLIWGLLSDNLVDEISMFLGNIIIGGKESPSLADGTGFIRESDFPRLTLKSAEPMDEGLLITWRVQ